MPSLIDKLFKRKLQDREFSPEAGDWAAMEKLINTDMGYPPNSSASINWMFISVLVSVLSISIYAGFTKQEKITEANQIEKSNIEDPSNDAKKISESQLHSSINADPAIDTKTISKPQTPSADLGDPAVYSKTNSDPQKLYSVKDENTLTQQEGRLNEKQANFTSSLTHESTSFPKEGSTFDQEADKAHKNEKGAFNDLSASNNNSINEVGSPEATSVVMGTATPTKFKKEELENSPKEHYPRPKEAQSDLTIEEMEITENEYKKDSRYYKDGSSIAEDKANSSLLSKELKLQSSSIMSLDIKLKEPELLNLYDSGESPFPIAMVKKRRNLPLQFSIAPYGEISYVMKNVSGDREFTSLINLRNTEEKNILSLGYGLEFQTKFKQLSFTSGFGSINWGENVQYEEQYQYEWDVTSTSISDTVWTNEIVFVYDSIYDPIDSSWVIYVMDSSFVEVIDSINIITSYDSTQIETALGLSDQNGRTKISYWEVPLYFSYQFDLGDFYLSPGLGITLGFLKISQGYYMAENMDSLIPINTNYAVLRKTVISGQINLGIGYRFADKFAVEATPVYRFNLGSVFENTAIIQRYSSLSLQLKLRYYF
jgi:hypothetical protein